MIVNELNGGSVIINENENSTISNNENNENQMR